MQKVNTVEEILTSRKAFEVFRLFFNDWLTMTEASKKYALKAYSDEDLEKSKLKTHRTVFTWFSVFKEHKWLLQKDIKIKPYQKKSKRNKWFIVNREEPHYRIDFPKVVMDYLMWKNEICDLRQELTPNDKTIFEVVFNLNSTRGYANGDYIWRPDTNSIMNLVSRTLFSMLFDYLSSKPTKKNWKLILSVDNQVCENFLYNKKIDYEERIKESIKIIDDALKDKLLEENFLAINIIKNYSLFDLIRDSLDEFLATALTKLEVENK